MKKLGLVLLLICTIAFYYHYKKGDLPFELPFQERNSSTSEEYSQNEEPGISTKAYVGNIRNHKLHSINCENLPYEDNRVYFSTIEEAQAAGYTDKHYECMGN